MMPHENAVRHRPTSVLLASATLGTSWLSGVTAGRLCDPLPLCMPAGRGVLNTGRGVCRARGDGATVGDISTGGAVRTPTFILKLLFPRYTTLSFSPPGTSSATTSFLPFFFGRLFAPSAYDTRPHHVKALCRLREFLVKSHRDRGRFAASIPHTILHAVRDAAR